MARYDTIDACVKDALAIQDACNLSAVIRAWGEMQTAIREHARESDTPFAIHPVQILMLSKVTSLMGVNADCIGGVQFGNDDAFRQAYVWAKEFAS